MIRFLHPEALLLALVPVAVLRRRFVAGPWTATVLRALVAFLLAAALAVPTAGGTEEGRDLVVVVDRSLSISTTAATAIDEALDRAAREAGPMDRVGVVVFGRGTAVEVPPTRGYRRAPFVRTIDGDGSNLAAALDAADALIPPDRPGSILLLSDGESTAGDAAASARRSARRGVRVDAIVQRRATGGDTAVEELEPPVEAALGEPIQFAAWIRSERATEADFRLLRDGVEIARGRRAFRAGLDRLSFRDRIAEPGVHAYELALDGLADRIPENDRAKALVRVAGPLRILCVTPHGREDRLTRSLASAGLSIAVVPPERAPSTFDALDGVRAVVLEDVAAGALPARSLAILARYVTDLGGGLLMTGGRASFGPGGYHKSAVGEILPVSLELREERRKFSLTMAIVLDRSGSMAISVASGATKMDLANQGAVAAVELLSALDSVAVIAVDSEPHLVVPMGPVRDKASIASRIRSIESMGGGIFTSTGIHAAAGQLGKAGPGVRHIVLFADAADAEEPGDLATFVPSLVKAGVTVSVIGLGSESDSDADFLKSVARDGGGRATFTADAADLPRVFAEETIQVSKAALVEETTALRARPELALLGALAGVRPPSIGGYDVAYPKSTARVAIETADAERVPILAYHPAGLGRVATYLGVADGELSGGFATWDRYADLFATTVRWTAGVEASGDLFAEVSRRGHEGRVVIEAEAGREAALAGARATLVGPDGEPKALLLRRSGDARVEGTFEIDSAGSRRVVVSTASGEVIRTAPLVIPYSPEFEPRLDPREGERLLGAIAEAGGGRVDPAAGTLFDGSRLGGTLRSLVIPCLVAALLAFVLEILARRTSWVPRIGALVRLVRGRRGRGVAVPSAAVTGGAAPGTAAPTATAPPSFTAAPAPAPESAAGPASAPPAAPEPRPGGIASAVDRAKAKRRR